MVCFGFFAVCATFFSVFVSVRSTFSSAFIVFRSAFATLCCAFSVVLAGLAGVAGTAGVAAFAGRTLVERRRELVCLRAVLWVVSRTAVTTGFDGCWEFCCASQGVADSVLAAARMRMWRDHIATSNH